MQLCKNCILNNNFPRIDFDETGLCNFCARSKNKITTSNSKQKYKSKFERLVQDYKGKSHYDCIVAFSAGKDSTYTLKLMKDEYKLNVLAFSFNNWFQSDVAIKNIHRVIQNIGVDHTTFLPSFEDFKRIILASISGDLYPLKALERATSICTSCLSLIRFACFRLAIEKEIPFVIFGLSPGQAPLATSLFKTNAEMLRKMQNAILYPLQQHIGNTVNKYFLEERHYQKKDSFPYSINPLSFVEYDEKTIYEVIQPLGWQSPEDTDANSTNCLLNGFANQIHLEKHGYHPYTMELAGLVREGILSRDDALHRLSEEPDHQIIQQVKSKLGLLE